MHIISNDINPFSAIRISKLLKAESQIEKQNHLKNKTRLNFCILATLMLFCVIFLFT